MNESTHRLGAAVDAPQALCVCGHPASRHLYGTGLCTTTTRRLDAKGQPTTTYDECRCREFTPR